MKKILMVLSLLFCCMIVCTKTNLLASSAQDSDYKLKFILARRDGQREIFIATEALDAHKLEAISAAQVRLASARKKLVATIDQLKSAAGTLDGMQVANDLKGLQEVVRKLDETDAQLKVRQAALEATA